MKRLIAFLILAFLVGACRRQPVGEGSLPASGTVVPADTAFSPQEVKNFAALDPIDTHVHVFKNDAAFSASLKKLNLHVLDILLVSDLDPHESEWKDLSKQRVDAWSFVHGSDGYAALCSSIDPFKLGQPDFAETSIRGINEDFSKGAVAVKIWKNIGMELKDARGKYVMADDPAFAPIYKDIAAHNKTLVAHLADPNTIWEAPNKAAPDYEYYTQHPELYMYGRVGAPSKAEILRARDHVLELNPNLRVVGAHLGSMEADFDQLGEHLDKYPNLAVDIAGRMPYFEMKTRAQAIDFLTKYQDRLIYATDNALMLGDNAQKNAEDWNETYAHDWRFFATNDTIIYANHKVQGLALPQAILRKLYHDNAVRWFPGIIGSTR